VPSDDAKITRRLALVSSAPEPETAAWTMAARPSYEALDVCERSLTSLADLSRG